MPWIKFSPTYGVKLCQKAHISWDVYQEKDRCQGTLAYLDIMAWPLSPRLPFQTELWLPKQARVWRLNKTRECVLQSYEINRERMKRHDRGNHWRTHPIEVSHMKVKGIVKYGPMQRRWIILCIQERSDLEFLEEADSSAEKLRAKCRENRKRHISDYWRFSMIMVPYMTILPCICLHNQLTWFSNHWYAPTF